MLALLQYANGSKVQDNQPVQRKFSLNYSKPLHTFLITGLKYRKKGKPGQGIRPVESTRLGSCNATAKTSTLVRSHGLPSPAVAKQLRVRDSRGAKRSLFKEKRRNPRIARPPTGGHALPISPIPTKLRIQALSTQLLLTT